MQIMLMRFLVAIKQNIRYVLQKYSKKIIYKLRIKRN